MSGDGSGGFSFGLGVSLGKCDVTHNLLLDYTLVAATDQQKSLGPIMFLVDAWSFPHIA